MKKRLAAILLALCLSAALSACGDAAAGEEASGRAPATASPAAGGAPAVPSAADPVTEEAPEADAGESGEEETGGNTDNIPRGEPRTEEELAAADEQSRLEEEAAREQRSQGASQVVLEPMFVFGPQDEWSVTVTGGETALFSAFLRDLRLSDFRKGVTADYGVRLSLTMDGEYREYALLPFGAPGEASGRVLIRQTFPAPEEAPVPEPGPPVDEEDEDAIPAQADPDGPDLTPWTTVDAELWNLIGEFVDLPLFVEGGEVVWYAVAAGEEQAAG